MKNFPHSFNYYALRFLLQWEQVERPISDQFGRTPSVESLRKAMHHFRISRSFKDIANDGKATLVLKALRQAHHKIAAENVNLLAERFKKDFNSYNLSAASKLLWLSHKNPYLIYDSRAVTALKRLGYQFDIRSYADYESTWRTAYTRFGNEISVAADRLEDSHPFFSHWYPTKKSLLATSRQAWFKERIFDFALWENGGDG